MKAEKVAIENVKFLKDLLEEFGLRLTAFDPGVVGSHMTKMGSWETIRFNHEVWEFIEPLLVELRDRRRNGAKR